MTVLDKIKSKSWFISKLIPHDFQESTGQYALEVFYTNGDKDMFTTPMLKEKGYDPGDFKSEDEYFETLKLLKQLGVI